MQGALCKSVFTGDAAACDPDASWWDRLTLGGNIWDCDAARKTYWACIAAGIPLAPAPAPPPISTNTAANNDPTLVDQANAATASTFSDWASQIATYFDGATGASAPGPSTTSPNYLLWGALAIGAVLLLRRR